MNRRVVLSVEKKLKLLKDYEQNLMKCGELSAKYKVDKSTVYKIIKNSANIKKVSNSCNLKTLRQRKGDHPDIEKALLIWFNEMRGQNAVVTDLMLLNKAKEFAVNLEKDFEPNTSWLFRWKKRNRICVGKISGESKDSDENGASNFIENQLPQILQEYTPECIFNGDESGLYYKALPNTTYFNKGSPPKGWKMQKSRLTLLFICNSTGSYKRVFVIGKPGQPRCFKNKNIPITYFSNKNSWMTVLIWNDILSILEEDMKKIKKKIILFVDNASCHKTTITLTNITVQYLPPNTTAIIQPPDQGIIHSFKQQYRQIIVKKQICAIERGKTVPEYIKSISILDALHFIKRAWWLIKPECIENCFKKAGFNNNRDIHEIEEEADCVSEVLTVSSEYQHCDDELICHGILSDADILDDVASDKSVEEYLNNFDDEDPYDSAVEVFHCQQTKITSKEVLDSVEIIRKFCSDNEISQNLIFEEIESFIVKACRSHVLNVKFTRAFLFTTNCEYLHSVFQCVDGDWYAGVLARLELAGWGVVLVNNTETEHAYKN